MFKGLPDCGAALPAASPVDSVFFEPEPPQLVNAIVAMRAMMSFLFSFLLAV